MAHTDLDNGTIIIMVISVNGIDAGFIDISYTCKTNTNKPVSRVTLKPQHTVYTYTGFYIFI